VKEGRGSFIKHNKGKGNPGRKVVREEGEGEELHISEGA